MGSKIGLILSFIFVVGIFFFYGDMINIQIIHANLDAVAITAGHLIVESGKITDSISDFVYEQAKATITCRKNCTPRFGDTYIYDVATTYEPIIMSEQPLVINITRSVVIGYYNK